MSGIVTEQIVASFGESIGDGQKIPTVAGTFQPLVPAPTAAYVVIIQAKETNTGNIYVGGPTSTLATSIVLNPSPIANRGGDAIRIDTKDLNKVQIASQNVGEGVSFIYWKPV